MTPYILGALMIVAVVMMVVTQKWPRIWVALRFPDSSSWPMISATVEQGIVHTYYGDGSTTYLTEIIYSYQMNGEYYSGRYRRDFNSQAFAEGLIQQYPKGCALQIRVNPSRPELSILG